MAETPPISFPDGPRSALEQTIQELIERAHRVLESQGRLRSLIHANAVVVEKLSLGEVLRRIVEVGVSLVGAQYGALGVVAPDGHLEQFIHVGMPDDTVTSIGHLPEGHGLLGAVIDSGEPIRLPHLGDDERSVGFPEHHPPMDSFLGVPIRVRDEVYGNLYLTNREGGAFSSEDEELIAALAVTAGIAIDNARLFDESDRRRRWSAALTDVTSALLSGSGDVLAVVADRAGSAVDADLVCIIVPAVEDGMLEVRLARGTNAADIEGRVYPAAGSLAGRALADDVIATVETDLPDTADWQPHIGPSIALPLKAAGEPLGVLTLSRRPGAGRFLNTDLDMAAEFAAQAGVAMELGRAREDRQHLELVGERSRIARDLHDHVIQRLFAAGMSLQTIADAAPAQSAKINAQVDAIDAAIADIRTAIFTLGQTSDTTTRHRVLDIATEAAPALGFTPRVTFTGPVDLFVTDLLADDVTAVVREALSNIAQHAQAGAASVEVSANDERIVVTVDDDGVGLAADRTRRSGTGNLAARAEARRGSFELSRRETGGTRAVWIALLAEGNGDT
jgi:signal transduction histidine kinase